MKTLVLLTAALAVPLFACTEAQSPTPRTAESIKSAPPPSSCPLGVRGARVIYEDTETGARLTFTAPPEQLDALRRRARDAAAMHGPRGLGEGHDGRHGNGGNHGLRPMQMPPAAAGVEDLDGGARIDLRPYHEGDLTELRVLLRQRARELMASCEEPS